ncbi:hypothetical protein Taro_008442 [Colocasia esculenta]|uniref:Retrotransposon gag domain-containing protein n=1 Tax=Colocasia esculenta TaxID=4460 RepID=A0A843TY87_COLES|nr:hypothetical protein [Colocasia esculenta]
MDSHMADELVVPLKFPGDSVHFLSLLALVTMKIKRKSKSRMGMRPSDERSNYESIYRTLITLTLNCNGSQPMACYAGDQAATVRNGAGDLHRNFRSLNPPRFSGSPDPDEAENWNEEIERIFQVMQCTNREKDARALWKATSAHLPNVGKLEWAGFLEIFRGKYFSERVKEKKAAEFAALKQKGMSMSEYEAQFARLAVYAPHLVGTKRLKANRFMDGLRPMFIERLGPHNIQTYTKMVQRAQLVEDTMAKVEGMRGKDNSKPVFVKKGSPNISPPFCNNNVNNNNMRPNVGRDVTGDKRVKVEGRQLGTELKNAGRSSGHA